MNQTRASFAIQRQKRGGRVTSSERALKSERTQGAASVDYRSMCSKKRRSRQERKYTFCFGFSILNSDVVEVGRSACRRQIHRYGHHDWAPHASTRYEEEEGTQRTDSHDRTGRIILSPTNQRQGAKVLSTTQVSV